jgi:hypothetical protein
MEIYMSYIYLGLYKFIKDLIHTHFNYSNKLPVCFEVLVSKLYLCKYYINQLLLVSIFVSYELTTI